MEQTKDIFVWIGTGVAGLIALIFGNQWRKIDNIHRNYVSDDKLTKALDKLENTIKEDQKIAAADRKEFRESVNARLNVIDKNWKKK